MGELIGALAEAFVAMVMAIIALLPIVAEVSMYVAACAIGISLYALLPKFRNRKRQEWNGQPLKKYLYLGTGTVCVGAIVALAVFLSLPRRKPALNSNEFATEQAGNGEELRLVVRTDSGQGATSQVRIAVKEGGITKILHTKSLNELEQAVRENVKVQRSKAVLTNQAEAPPGKGSPP